MCAGTLRYDNEVYILRTNYTFQNESVCFESEVYASKLFLFNIYYH